MREPLAKMVQTTSAQDLLEIMRETYLVETKAEARAALTVTLTAIRAWLRSAVQQPPKTLRSRINLPGVGTISAEWYGYQDRFPPQLMIRFRASKAARQTIRRLNTQERRQFYQQHPELTKTLSGAQNADQKPHQTAQEPRTDAPPCPNTPEN